jgi:hypothetical protein
MKKVKLEMKFQNNFDSTIGFIMDLLCFSLFDLVL